MGRIIFFVEEQSMANTLRKLLFKLYPKCNENEHWVVIPHRGKSELERSIPRKLRGWKEPNAKFVILRDNDGGNCIVLKQRLRDIITGIEEKEVMIRIVCQELESWFLGDLRAIKSAYPKASVQPDRISKKYRDPDTLTNASEELTKLTGTRAKIARSELIADYLKTLENRSHSFNTFFEYRANINLTIP